MNSVTRCHCYLTCITADHFYDQVHSNHKKGPPPQDQENHLLTVWKWRTKSDPESKMNFMLAQRCMKAKTFPQQTWLFHHVLIQKKGKELSQLALVQQHWQCWKEMTRQSRFETHLCRSKYTCTMAICYFRITGWPLLRKFKFSWLLTDL